MSHRVKGASATYFGLFLLQRLLRYIFSHMAGGCGGDIFENRLRESCAGDPFNVGLVGYTWFALLSVRSSVTAPVFTQEWPTPLLRWWGDTDDPGT